MRLVCPNCAAQYEVDDSAIPDNGRDVQCANCGNTWFQGPAAAAPNEGDAQGEAEHETAHETGHLSAPTPRATDPSVLDILRREAEHETTVRNSEIEAAERENARSEQDREQGSDEGGDTEDGVATEWREDTPKGESDADADTDDMSDDLADDVADDGNDDRDGDEDGGGDGEQDDELPAETFALRARAGRARLRANRSDIERAHHQRQQISTQDTDDASGFEEIAPTPQQSAPDIEDREDTDGRSHSSLPEIKELQESLRIARDKTNRAEPAELDVTNPKGRGGRAGFFIAVLLALILVAVYALKAQIIASLPQAEPYLNQYTALVDAGRRGLASAIDAIISLARDLMAKYL